jgi:site-specific DNA recombinase
LDTIPAAALDQRQEGSERQREHIGEPRKRAAESELSLKRLCDAIVAGVADLDDPALKDRIEGLKDIHDQAKGEAERAQAMLRDPGRPAVMPQMLSIFARTARQRIRPEGAATAATSFARSPSGSRSPKVRSASSDRSPRCSKRW